MFLHRAQYLGIMTEISLNVQQAFLPSLTKILCKETY
jgi:hypothetical protein